MRTTLLILALASLLVVSAGATTINPWDKDLNYSALDNWQGGTEVTFGGYTWIDLKAVQNQPNINF